MTFACGGQALLDGVNNHLNEKLSNMWMILQVLSLSCFLRCSRILISSWACRWNLFSFLTILRATCWWVLWSYTLSTCPNEPLPITFRISYLKRNYCFSPQEYCPLNVADDELNLGRCGKLVERELEMARLWMKRGEWDVRLAISHTLLPADLQNDNSLTQDLSGTPTPLSPTTTSVKDYL